MATQFEVFNKEVLEIENICTNCNKLLNVAPIYSVEKSKNKCEKICGRCVKATNSYNKTRKCRQIVYENFAKFLTFPCSNKRYGCKHVLSWDDVVAHEKICKFEGLKCPFSQRKIFTQETCNWEGNVAEFKSHIEESHQPYMLNTPYYFEWLDIKENMIFFSTIGTQLVTIVIKYETESTYYCLVMVNGSDIESQCYRYQLELFNEDKSNSIILRKMRLEPLSLMMEYFRNPDKVLEIDFIKVKQMLKYSESVIARFGIVKKPKKEIALITEGKDIETLSNLVIKPKEKRILDENLLQELECPVCNEHMLPPIFICKTGHSICSICRLKVSTCPNCRDIFSGARNFTLEKLTTRVNYPCRNRDQGCTFVTTSDKILEHKNSCLLSEGPCLFSDDCSWIGKLSAMYNHLSMSHQNNYCEVNVMQVCDNRNMEVVYFMYQYNELFRFTIKKEYSSFGYNGNKFNIQHIGLGEEDPKFRYQVQIIDHSPLERSLTFTDVAYCLTDLTTAFSKSVFIPSILLKPFIAEELIFYYKILITKI